MLVDVGLTRPLFLRRPSRLSTRPRQVTRFSPNGVSRAILSERLPGSAAWIGGGSYYVLDAAQVADLVNEKLNPYQKEVTVVDLAIRAG